MVMNEMQAQLIRMIQTGRSDNIALALLLAESQGVDLSSFLEDCARLLAPQPAEPAALAELFSWRELAWAQPLVWLPAYRYQRKAKAEPMLYLHPAIGWLEQLEYLDLSNHYITDLPAEIGLLQNLRCLRINNNQLRSLPVEIGRLRQLEQLELSVNQLKQLPPEIGKLKSLRQLNLDFNPIAQVELDRLERLLPHTRIVAKQRPKALVWNIIV